MIHIKTETRGCDEARFFFISTGSFKKRNFKMRSIVFVPNKKLADFRVQNLRSTMWDDLWFLLNRRWR